MATAATDYDLVGSYDNQRISTISAQRTVNMFEYMDAEGKRPKALLSTAGLVDAGLDFGAEMDGSRATFVFDGAIYQVYGDSVFRITGSTGLLTTSLIGTLTTTAGYVGIDANTFQVIIVDGQEGWIWDINQNSFQEITDTGFPANPIDVCYLDGFFLVANGDTNNFQLSKINQGMVWSGGTTLNPSAIFTADAATDILTLSTSNANFATGVPVTVAANGGTATFTADSGTDILTLSTTNANFQTGTALSFTTTGSLPSPLVIATTYYSIMVGASTTSPGTIKVATTRANALAGIAIDLTTNGAPTNTVTSGGGIATFTADSTTDILTLSTSNANFATGASLTFTTTGSLPNPLVINTTYYAIMIGSPSTNPGTIKVALSRADALANIAIDLTTNGSPTNIVTAASMLPSPLVVGTTYYVIRIGPSTTNPGTIKLATSYANAVANIAIDILTDGTPINTIAVSGQLQLGSITSHPGNIVACRTLHRRIFLFSQNYTEVWENAGLGTNLPFRRNNSLLMEVGTPALGSISVGFDRMFFLAQDKDGLAGVMEVKGSESILVSNRALDFQLAQYAADPDTGVADARGILIKENGLIFYRLNFTLANHTFVLNVTMSTADSPKWHEEEVLNGDRHPAQTHAYFDGVNYYGDYKLPLFYIVADGVSTNNGEAIRRMRIGKEMSPDGYSRLRIDRFQVDLLQGQVALDEYLNIDILTEESTIITTESNISIITEQDINIGGGHPVVFLSISKDGGQTYGNLLQAPMGRIGERTYRTLWRKLGTTPRGQGFIPKVEFFNDIPFIILGAAWASETLPE